MNHFTPEMLTGVLKWIMSGERGSEMATGASIFWEDNPIDMTDVEIVMVLADHCDKHRAFIAELSFAIFLSKMGVQARKEGKGLPSREDVAAYVAKVEKDVQAVLSLTRKKTDDMLSKTLKKKAASK